ncbi:MAG: NAD(P)H-dependent oxidoreductase [Flavobacteriaceae bacterium]|nr:NAD(P)H-dependent oxidoreductase [Bacteroidia bacterium]NNK82482.1 NAD(P)H-dependent oxidoreductase [Flavobacteriaceae bacterium]
MNILESLRNRYAVKKFDPTKYLPEAKLNIIKETFNLTPTSYGLQPLKMLVLRDKELQKKLVPYSYNQQMIGDASDLLVFCAIEKIDKAYIMEYFEREKAVRGTADEVVKPFRDFLISDFGGKTQEQIHNWAVNQIYIALGNLMTVCAAEEIDACPVEGFVPSEYDRVLKLNELGLKSVLIMPIGYRAEDDIFATFNKVRKPLENSVFEL